MFGQPVEVNADGNTTIKSYPGAIVSFFLTTILMLYVINQSKILFFRLDTNIIEDKDPNGFSNTYNYSMTENKMLFAFGVESTIDNDPKDNPEYIEWITYT